MEVLLLLVMALANALCFMIGAKVGQTVSKGEKVELPSVNPMEAYRKRESKKEADREQKRLDTIMRNIEMYRGEN